MHDSRLNIIITTVVSIMIIAPFIPQIDTFIAQITDINLADIVINPELYLLVFVIAGIIGMIIVNRYIKSLDQGCDDREYVNIYCPECGSQFLAGEEFCHTCGSVAYKRQKKYAILEKTD